MLMCPFPVCFHGTCSCPGSGLKRVVETSFHQKIVHVCVLSIEQFSTFARVDFVNSIFYTWCHKYNCMCQEELFSKTSPASGAGDSDVPRCTKSCCFSGCSIIVANVKKSNLQAHGAAKPKEVFVCRKRWQMSSENRVQQVWQAEASLGPAPRS